MTSSTASANLFLHVMQSRCMAANITFHVELILPEISCYTSDVSIQLCDVCCYVSSCRHLRPLRLMVMSKANVHGLD